MEADGPKDLSHFFAAMLGVQRHLLNILKSKGPEEATAYASYLTGLSNGKSQATAQLALPSLTDEDDPAVFLSLFERAALSAQLPELQWVSALASLVTGDALAAFDNARGGGDGHLTFQDLKATLLDRTRLAEESCRVRFRLQQGGGGQGPRVLAQELLQEATGWLRPHSRSGWEVMQCVVTEQFNALLPEPVAVWVRAARPVSLDEAVKVAETQFLLSADSAQWKEASCEMASKMLHSAPERNCPPSPQRIPDGRDSPTKLQSNTMKFEATETFTVNEQPEINEEGSEPQGTVQRIVQHPLPSSPLREDLQRSHSTRNLGSDTSGEGDKSESLGNPGCNTLQYPVKTLSGHWGQQSPEQGPSGAGEEGEGGYVCGYVCGKCGKSFLFFKSLHRHQRVHSNQGPFLCSECGFSCRTTTGLKRHRVVHSGNKLFPCSDCNESFTYAERLVHHRTAHAALRPHHCSVCQKSFRLKKVLKRHEQTHR
ncbi:hypothetical protein SKAU_G00090880 [Synaphobranchus kaupii]|uniref:Uncharacterized protein n=1 Tax=Synaphobranchus kaupii TaxID=118154 RepID=A0A9Q1J4A8_SYNKA|nr:hypothetical protein SKAU_G00090880 [Synaphobranchus kaupii]